MAIRWRWPPRAARPARPLRCRNPGAAATMNSSALAAGRRLELGRGGVGLAHAEVLLDVPWKR